MEDHSAGDGDERTRAGDAGARSVSDGEPPSLALWRPPGADRSRQGVTAASLFTVARASGLEGEGGALEELALCERNADASNGCEAMARATEVLEDRAEHADLHEDVDR